MAKFLTGNKLNLELEQIFENAENQLILISPYFKLHDRYISTLKSKIDDHELEIVIVFGKNENDITRSMKKEDFDFFRDFPNIEIRYEKRLHAKYYANENAAIIGSMNLYSYSQDNNIEAGIVINSKGFIGGLTSLVVGSEDVDYDAYDYFQRVIKQSELLYKRTPKYESKMLGLTSKYISSIVEIDRLSDFFEGKTKTIADSMSNSKSSDLKVNSQNEIKLLSTTALSKEIGISSKELFSKFESLKWITKDNEEWVLTSIGIEKGAQIKRGQYGSYIAWPERIIKEVK